VAGYEHRTQDPSSLSLLGMTTRLALLGMTVAAVHPAASSTSKE
jgi:hypothetical protein